MYRKLRSVYGEASAAAVTVDEEGRRPEMLPGGKSAPDGAGRKKTTEDQRQSARHPD